jgi:DNA-binding MarR family transcriptional regulator
VQNSVNYADLGAATAGTTFFRSIGGSFGTSVFGAIFDHVLPRNLQLALHGLRLPPGVGVIGGASPAALAKLPPPVHAAFVSGYAASIRTAFLAAVPVGAVAFVLAWTLKELPLRRTSRAVDQADRLAPTARPTIRTSGQEMRRAVSSLLSRERRREVYSQLLAASGVAVSPRAGWLLLRLGEHRGESRGAIASRLFISVPELSDRMTELVQAGYVTPAEPAPDAADELTESGNDAYVRIFAARRDMIVRLLDGWQPELHPRLLELVTEITHELAASGERPDSDLDLVRQRSV